MNDRGSPPGSDHPGVLVTGAAGVLGRRVVEELARAGAKVRGTGRRPRPRDFPSEWRSADLLTGDGLADTLAGIDVVVHGASNPYRPQDDLDALDRLLPELRARSIHLVFVSIAGIPEGESFAYYAMKLECERRLAGSDVSFTVARATQFHPFVDAILRRLRIGPFLLAPNWTLQPVDLLHVAARLKDHALARTRGVAPEIHGPETLDFAALAAPWLAARGERKWRIPVPGIGPLGALARVRRLSADAGGRRWSEWVAAEASRESPYER